MNMVARRTRCSSLEILCAIMIIKYLNQGSAKSGPRAARPAREFHPSGLWRLVSFNIKFVPENIPMMSGCFHAERDLVAH